MDKFRKDPAASAFLTRVASLTPPLGGGIKVDCVFNGDIWTGTKSELVLEAGLLPDGFKFPRGNNSAEWIDGNIECTVTCAGKSGGVNKYQVRRRFNAKKPPTALYVTPARYTVIATAAALEGMRVDDFASKAAGKPIILIPRKA